MPYTKTQCRALFAKKAQGKKVPKDLRKHCRRKETKRAR